jgi:hypothetical protein
MFEQFFRNIGKYYTPRPLIRAISRPSIPSFFNNLLARLENETLRTHLETLLAARLSVS